MLAVFRGTCQTRGIESQTQRVVFYGSLTANFSVCLIQPQYPDFVQVLPLLLLWRYFWMGTITYTYIRGLRVKQMILTTDQVSFVQWHLKKNQGEGLLPPGGL